MDAPAATYIRGVTHSGSGRPRVGFGRLASQSRAAAHLPRSRDNLGLTWAELGAGDVPNLARLVERVEHADSAPFRTAPDELLEYFTEYQECQVVGARDEDGELRAYGAVRASTATGGPVRAICSGDVDPDIREHGVGTAILTWQLTAGRDLVHRLSGGAGGVVVVHVDDGRDDTRSLLERAGFTEARAYVQLRRDLSEPIPDVELERNLRVEPWQAPLEDSIRRAHNKAFEGSALTQQHTAESWEADRTFFVPEWSFVALDRSSDRAQVAGYLMSSRYEQDWPALGWTEGSTDLVGVLPPYRGRHVASALLAAAMRAYREAGMQYAGMDVDAADESGAYDLATNLGYEAIHRSLAYAIEV